MDHRRSARRLAWIALSCITAVCGTVGCSGPEDGPPQPAEAVPTDGDPEVVEPSDTTSETAPAAADAPEPEGPAPRSQPEPDVAVAPPSAEAEARIDDFLATKMIPGWDAKRTTHYLVVHDEDVDARTVRRVAEELEVLRTRQLERLLPPARPIGEIVIVRICESRGQYAAYGAPGGSAGYWSPYHCEVVLYQDRNDKKDAVRVAYSVTSEAYLHHALGGMEAHPWFVNGHGDYFAGHVYRDGELLPRPFGWRTATAREAKARWKDGIHRIGDGSQGAEGERLTLAEWLSWSRGEYEGRNVFAWSVGSTGSAGPDLPPRPVPGAVNAALGWSLVWFLRTTDDPAYRLILPRYWETLTALARDGTDDALDTTERSRRLALALTTALEGIDVERLERDWLAHTWEE